MGTRKYFGYKLRQRQDEETISFFVFNARAKDIQQWAGIVRVPDYAGGTQRAFREPRARAITRFLQAESVNTIPNSVLIAFNQGATVFTPLEDKIISCLPEIEITNGCTELISWGTLEFEFEDGVAENERLALIVDGQHRLNGMYEFGMEDIPAVIIGLMDAPLKEQAFHFIVINNKAVRVPTESAKSIIADLDETQEDELGERLLKAGIKYKDVSPILREINDLEASPFKDLLDWSYNRKGARLVPLTAVEQSLRYLKGVFTFFDEDEDSLLEVFLALWRAVKSTYAHLWGNEDNNLMKKVCLNAINEFVSDRLKLAWQFGLLDIFQPETVEKQVEQIMLPVPASFWESMWSIRIQDNANIRGLIKADMEQMAENRKLRKRWDEDLELISAD